jgi:hypothetical protein
MSRRVPSGNPPPEWPDEPARGHGFDGQGYGGPGFGERGYGERGFSEGQEHGWSGDGDGRGAPGQDQYGQNRYSQDQYGQYHQYGQYGQGRGDSPGYRGPRGYGDQPGYDGQQPGPQQYGAQGYGAGAGAGQGQDPGYESAPTQAYGYQDDGYNSSARSPGDGPSRRSPAGGQQRYQGPGRGPGGPASSGQQPRRPQTGPTQAGPGRGRKVRLRRTRRFFRRRVVRVISAVVALFLVLVMFSAGQAAFKSNGQGLSANLAEWARDHYLGPVVTFGEWLSYNPPQKGGKPSFSLAVPSGQAVTPSKAPTGKGSGKGGKKAFVPDIPATLKSLAPSPLTGEGQWRVVEKVKGEPAILTTFLRDATYTSYVNGVASIDQRLVKFSLRPGTEDPGGDNWGVSNYIPAGQRKGLLATFNGGFKLDSAGGGFYLNGHYHGSLVTGAASIVYYKNGTVKIGQWGRDFKLTAKVTGVRQNLKLLVDHGKVSANANSDVMSNWGATLGGGAYVWRSGLGITKDGRIVYVYGPALNAQDLGELLQRAGAVEGMQMDINPSWMKFDYYQAKGNPSDPTPVTLLPTQEPAANSYLTPSTRDFTAVYAR